MTISKLVKRPGILIVGPLPPPVGGVQTAVKIILESYLSRKYDFLHFDITRRRCHKHAGTIKFYNIFLFFRQFVGLVYLLLNSKPKIAHVPIYSGLAFWKQMIFLAVCNVIGVSTIAHFHGGDAEAIIAKSNKILKRFTLSCLRKSNAIVTLCENRKRFILNFVPSGANVRCIPNTIEPEFLNQGKGSGAQETRQEDRKVILFIGRISKQKGIFDLIRAIGKLTKLRMDFCLRIVGPEGDKAIREKILETAAEEGILDHLELIGEILGPDRLSVYRSASMLVLPSYIESFPMVILEAMCFGIPIIATDVGGIPEILSDGKEAFLIKPGDVTQLTANIDRLLGDGRLREKMGKAALEKFRGQYSPEQILPLVDKLYQDLLSTVT